MTNDNALKKLGSLESYLSRGIDIILHESGLTQSSILTYNLEGGFFQLVLNKKSFFGMFKSPLNIELPVDDVAEIRLGCNTKSFASVANIAELDSQVSFSLVIFAVCRYSVSYLI